MYDGMNLYRGIVTYSSASTGDVMVKIPAVLGDSEVIAVSKLGRVPASGSWRVPAISTQVVVAVEDDRFSNVYLVYPALGPTDEYILSLFPSDSYVANAKGDILSASADNTPAILSVGSQNSFLTVDNSTATGLKWVSSFDNATFNNANSNYSVLKSPEEAWNVTASATSSTTTVQYLSATNWYFKGLSTTNWTFDFIGDGSTTLSSLLANNTSTTFVVLTTNGPTGYRSGSTVKVDGSTVTTRWQGGTAPSLGNANSIDIYTISILKDNTGALLAFASQTRFA
jgi:hypothetical protein